MVKRAKFKVAKGMFAECTYVKGLGAFEGGGLPYFEQESKHLEHIWQFQDFGSKSWQIRKNRPNWPRNGENGKVECGQRKGSEGSKVKGLGAFEVGGLKFLQQESKHLKYIWQLQAVGAKNGHFWILAQTW